MTLFLIGMSPGTIGDVAIANGKVDIAVIADGATEDDIEGIVDGAEGCIEAIEGIVDGATEDGIEEIEGIADGATEDGIEGIAGIADGATEDGIEGIEGIADGATEDGIEGIADGAEGCIEEIEGIADGAEGCIEEIEGIADCVLDVVDGATYEVMDDGKEAPPTVETGTGSRFTAEYDDDVLNDSAASSHFTLCTRAIDSMTLLMAPIAFS